MALVGQVQKFGPQNSLPKTGRSNDCDRAHLTLTAYRYGSGKITGNDACPPLEDQYTRATTAILVSGSYPIRAITKKAEDSMRNREFLSSIIFGVALLVATASAEAALLGSTVTATEFFPNLSTVFSGPQNAIVVDPGVEFPAIDNAGFIEITDNQIIWSATRSLHYPAGDAVNGFNGFIVNFAGAPTITNVTTDIGSDVPPASISFSSNEVRVDLADLTYAQLQRTVLNVTTAPVPIPAAIYLFGVALSGLGVMRRRLA